MWDDYLAAPGGCNTLLLGEEVTKTRKNVATVPSGERDRLIHAFIALDNQLYPGSISWWDMQQIAHDATHNHCGPSFLPWHRELINRFELLLRASDPHNPNTALNSSTVKLHYWDWTTDPRN